MNTNREVKEEKQRDDDLKEGKKNRSNSPIHTDSTEEPTPEYHKS